MIKSPGASKERDKSFFAETYKDFYNWSCDNYSEFWEEVWHFTNLIHSKTYDQVGTTSIGGSRHFFFNFLNVGRLVSN